MSKAIFRFLRFFLPAFKITASVAFKQESLTEVSPLNGQLRAFANSMP